MQHIATEYERRFLFYLSERLQGLGFVFLTFLLAGLSSQALAAPNRQNLHDVYFANTEHELHVFRIYGKKPGKTIMLIGGIQGDEPGGYLTADLYADITLKKGNLIVVPRANFYSILLNQRNGLTGDMNRKFDDLDKSQTSMEQEIVSILKELIDQADCLLNLHEGSGFYSPEWVSDMENPDCFGQSIIFDAAEYFSEQKQQPIVLAQMADTIISRVNTQIEDPRYHFRANNHDTVSPDTHHPEQRKSATYYALTRAHIPAFGVETSKSIRSNSQKVNFQKMVVNEFMSYLGIEPETPGPHMEQTQLNYVLIKINDGFPYAVPNETTIEVSPGDEVVVTDIIANYNRGLAADFLGMGSYNDLRLPFKISQTTRVAIRKDAETCGWVDILLKNDAQSNSRQTVSARDSRGNVNAAQKTSQAEPPEDDLLAQKLILHVDGQIITLAEGDEAIIPREKMFIIKGVQSNITRIDKNIFANLKGYAPPKLQNDGNDINYPIFPGKDLWKRYSENGKGIRYPINATYMDREIGRFWIHLQ